MNNPLLISGRAVLFFLLFLTPFSRLSEGQVNIVGYDSTNPNGSAGAPSPNLPAAEFDAPVTPLLLSRGPGLVPNQGVTFNSSSWSTATTFNAGSNDYVQWGWSASSAAYDLVDMTIQYDRSNSGPRQLAIQLSADGAAYQTIFSDPDVFIGDETHTIDLSSFDAIHTAVFRLFGFDADLVGGTLDIERFNADPSPSRAIIVRGINVSVPEPASALLLVFATPAILLRRRRRAS